MGWLKNNRLKKEVFLFLLMIIISINLVNSEVIVFNKYTTNIYLKKDGLLFDRNLNLLNTGKNPIIPGELHFKLYTDSDKKIKVDLTNVSALKEGGKILESQILKNKKNFDVVVNIWDPLLPGFNYNFKTNYFLKFKPTGFFFYNLVLPEEKTTIPVRNSRYLIYLPKKYHVTYAPGSIIKYSKDYVIVEFDNPDNIELEYSIIPLPKTGTRASNIFWIALSVLLLGLLFIPRIFIRRY